MTYPVKVIHTSISRSAQEVYHFAADPKNFPKWVAFVQTVRKSGDTWIAETDLGELHIKFCPPNDAGVIDHEVTLPDGQKVLNPMRVVPNNDGCEFTFILFWMPGRTEQEFHEDAKAVRRDLQKLKELMEKK